MTAAGLVRPAEPEEPDLRRIPLWRAVWRSGGGRYGAVIIALVLISAALSLVWTPYALQQTDTSQGWLGPSVPHPLGTDLIGRDTLSWLIAGSRTTVVIVLGSVLLAGVLGVGLGILSALLPGRLRESLVVAVDILVALPVLLIAILLAAPFGGSLAVVVLAVGIGAGVNVARVLRPEITRAAQSDFVLASRACGSGTMRRLRDHVIPTVGPLLVVQLSQVAGLALLSEAGLTFLGYGAPASTPSWGRSLAEAQHFIGVAPLSVMWPGLVIAATVLAVNLFGDALRDALDPRRRTPVAAPGAAPQDAAALSGQRPATAPPPSPALERDAATAGSAP